MTVAMITDVLWAAWDGRGLEHLRLDVGPSAVVADSLVIATTEAGHPYRARYRLECDAAWTVRHARIELLDAPGRALHIRADGRGHWIDASTGAALPLDGCIDIDIFPSPFTNTLPMRRLADMVTGRPRVIDVAWVALPELTVQVARQEYTRLDRGYDGARWRFRALDSQFTAELAVDRDSLVLDYPGLARRAATVKAAPDRVGRQPG
jgi:uncharacterized protein